MLGRTDGWTDGVRMYRRAETTAIKCTLNDVCVRKAIKPRINSRGQEARVLNWLWHRAGGKKKRKEMCLRRLPFGSTLLIRSRAFSLSSGRNKCSTDSLSSRPPSQREKKPHSFWQRRAIRGKQPSWWSSTSLDYSSSKTSKKKKIRSSDFRNAPGELRGEGVDEISFFDDDDDATFSFLFFLFVDTFVFLASATSQGAPQLIFVVETLQGKKSCVRLHSQRPGSRQQLQQSFTAAHLDVLCLGAPRHTNTAFFFFLSFFFLDCSAGAECSSSACFSCREWTIATTGQTDWKKKMENNRASMIWLHLRLFFFFGGGWRG